MLFAYIRTWQSRDISLPPTLKSSHHVIHTHVIFIYTPHTHCIQTHVKSYIERLHAGRRYPAASSSSPCVVFVTHYCCYQLYSFLKLHIFVTQTPSVSPTHTNFKISEVTVHILVEQTMKHIREGDLCICTQNVPI